MSSLCTICIALLYVNHLLYSAAAASSDTIVPNQAILDGGETLVSAAGVFELGFFSPPGSTGRYIGIWYKKIPVKTFVWVANRATPLNDTSGVLSLTGDGKLSLHLVAGGGALWSTNTSSLTDPIVHLLDSGNLVLSDGSNSTKWQSFDYPSDTLLPGMKIGRDPSTNLDRRLTSWKSSSDPSPGKYSAGVNVHVAPDIYVWNGTAPEVRSGPWDGDTWGGAPVLRNRDVTVNNFIPARGGGGGFYSYDMANTSVVGMLVLDAAGVMRWLVWQNQQWSLNWYSPLTQCDHYAHCGYYGLCNTQDEPICKCLPGFVSKSQESLNPAEKSEGCVRRATLGCRRGAAGDGFVNMAAVKVPELSSATADGSKSFDECRNGCLSDCNCTAFAFFGGSSGCISLFGDLLDVQQLPRGSGQDFYVRVAASELASLDPGNTRHSRLLIIVILSIGLFIFGTLFCLLWIIRHKKRGICQASNEQLWFSSSNDLAISLGENEERGMKFSLFHSSTINIATNNFSEENKLGEGGFGPVYKWLYGS